MKRIGKQGKINLIANRILKDYWQKNGINFCELKLKGCLKTWTLQNCHRHKRIYYKEHPEVKLYDRSEVLRACANCHSLVENNEKLREKVFQKVAETKLKPK